VYWYLLTGLVQRFAPLLYTPEGTKLIDQLWDETMGELKFVDPLSILADMKRKSEA
jgi:hypothetical protein